MRKILNVLLVLTLCLGLCACTAEDKPENPTEKTGYSVGVCQLAQHPALDSATQGFVDALKAAFGDDVTIDVQNAAGSAETCAVICNGFVASNYDLIMGNATNALAAAVSSTATIPVLGTAITEYGSALGIENFSGVVGGNVSGCSDLAPLDQQAAELVKLFPDAKKVAILFSSSEPNSLYQVKVITEELSKYGVESYLVSFIDSNDVVVATQQACALGDVIYIPTDNTCASCANAIASETLNNNVPVYAGEEGIASACGVATLTINYYDLGYATGEMAVKVLKGADISTMPIEYAKEFTKKYNPALAEKYGVTIPEDYVAIGE